MLLQECHKFLAFEAKSINFLSVLNLPEADPDDLRYKKSTVLAKLKSLLLEYTH